MGASAAEPAITLARRLSDRIRESCRCKASIGIGSNRLLARVATKEAKPRVCCLPCRAGECTVHSGVFQLLDSEAMNHLQTLPVRELPSVGPETEKKLSDLGVETVLHLQQVPEARLRSCLGEKQGRQMQRMARGLDDRPWVPRPPRKSVGSQISWGVRFDTADQARDFCRQLTAKAVEKLQKFQLYGTSLTIKVWKRQDCEPVHTTHVGRGFCDQISRSTAMRVEPSSVEGACAEVVRLFDLLQVGPMDIRGLGVHISGLEPLKSEAPRGSIQAMCSQRPTRVVRPESAPRVVIHLDCNCFFLSVHQRQDPSLRTAGPLVLWQYNDVICVSPEAKAAGVKKHMRPTDAQPLVEGINGRMIHAFSRKWPGPRVWYGPYTQSSREVFHFLRSYLDDALGDASAYVLERASIDEVYVDVTAAAAGSLDFALALCQRLVPALQESLGIRSSVGIARNRLLAKLASMAAKPPASGFRTIHDGDVDELLRSFNASKLPGLGGKVDLITSAGIQSIFDLQRYTCADLQRELALSADAASRVHESCRGVDTTGVRAADPKKSLSASSWVTDAKLADLAVKTHSGRGGASISVGDGWIFEPHNDGGVSNHTRVRWILLSLAMDLDERVVDEYLESGQLPTKLTVTCMGPGRCKEPGMPGFSDGRSRSRSSDFPLGAYRDVDAQDVRAVLQPVPASAHEKTFAPAPATLLAQSGRSRVHPVYGTEFLVISKSDGLAAMGVADGPEVLDDPRYRKRIAALINATTTLICRWAAEPNQNLAIATVCLAARSMIMQHSARLFASSRQQQAQRGGESVTQTSAVAAQSDRPLKRDVREALLTNGSGKRTKGSQCSLQQSFERGKTRSLPDSALVVPSFDISDSE
eukprot:TRINITY_DN16631_c0_g2_i1.p1 TRINITY_DN16631_c0_g2~~TRINITY_DN16631_c0_g2_i1.p1  ORF type:complete len:986 (+),score=147.52 TRINITY_DN16631_c0_g2_i1:347-2959(+)